MKKTLCLIFAIIFIIMSGCKEKTDTKKEPRLTEMISMWDYGNGLEEIDRWTYEYNKKGQQSLVKGYNADGLYGSTRFEYDSDGRLTAQIALDADGKENWREEFSYSGKLKTRTVRTEKENKTVTEYKYSDGLMISMSDSAGNRTEYENADGMCVRETVFLNGEKVGYTVHENGDGIVYDSTEYKADGTLIKCDMYEYDKSGRVTVMQEYGADKKLGYRVEYEYDSYGNQTKMTYFDASDNIMGTNSYIFKTY